MAEGIIDATAEQIIDVIEQMPALPWPDGDEWLTWEIDGLEGQTSWLTHVLPLASTTPTKDLDRWLAKVIARADQRWIVRYRFDATRFTDDKHTDPAAYDRRSAAATLIRAYHANDAMWWPIGGDAVMLIDGWSEDPGARAAVVLVLPADWLTAPTHEEQSPLVADFLSGDKTRVLQAMWEVVNTRDPAVLGPVSTALRAIVKATSEADLGGAFVANSSNLEHAFDRVRLFKSGACLCAAYPSHLTAYIPDPEERKGHVRIVGTKPNDRQWEPDHICECTACGQRYQVEQGEYHYTWWKWTKIA